MTDDIEAELAAGPLRCHRADDERDTRTCCGASIPFRAFVLRGLCAACEARPAVAMYIANREAGFVTSMDNTIKDAERFQLAAERERDALKLRVFELEEALRVANAR